MPRRGKFTRRWRLASACSSPCTASCSPVIPVKKLARLPVIFTDERGLPLILHAGSVLSYRDVAQLGQGRLVIHRKCIVTALAREAAQARHIQFIKQE